MCNIKIANASLFRSFVTDNCVKLVYSLDVLLQPTPAVTYRVTGGVLDFYLFVANSPEELVIQYHELIGKLLKCFSTVVASKKIPFDIGFTQE